MERRRSRAGGFTGARALATAATAFLGACGATDFLRPPTPQQRFHQGLASIGDLGAISGIRTARTWGMLRRPGQGEGEGVRFDEIQVVPHRTLVRLELGKRAWIGESDSEYQRWKVSEDGGITFEVASSPEQVPSLEGEPVWGLELGTGGQRLGRVSLPGWFRITEGLSEIALRSAPSSGSAARVEVDLPSLIEGGPTSRVGVDFDRQTGRPLGFERRFEVEGRERVLTAHFDDWRELGGIVLPTRQSVALDGVPCLEVDIEGARFNDSRWPVWVIENLPEWTSPPFPWYAHTPEPSDDLYRVQEEMFGTWWQREERGLRAASYDELAAAYVEGDENGQLWRLWVSEAGRFREEREAGAEVIVFDASDAPARTFRGGVEGVLDRTESAVRSWLFRTLLIRPLVRESLNAIYDDDLAVRMVVRQGVRERVDLSLRVVLDAARVRISSVEARPLAMGDGPPTHVIALRYSETGEIAGLDWRSPSGERTIALTHLERGAAAPLEAFQLGAWPRR